MERTIIIVDDELEIIEILRLFLEMEGFSILEARDGKSALNLIQKFKVDLAIIDIMMPNINGYELIKIVRREYKMPIIILSAKNQEMDKIMGLGLGADDFISKPFSLLEVLARIQAQLRRTYDFNVNSLNQERSQTCFDDLVLDHRSCILYKQGREIKLSALEYKLLKLFMGEPGRIFTKKQIFENVWSDYYCSDDNTIMVQISRLREKIEDHARNPVYLKTVRGLGYRFAKKEELNER
ncbi:response regulator transcription factor [Bacillus sp. Xin]|uniref:response regulator transcription factor n=1 Tax=unclassified Bacillus (in: firmicutes) TaxID=185979 RepID=UPI00157495CD|nr:MULTISPECIES: response regulator transcription factor [unclassified Bacillus (in: firmicutes)]MBC6972432.1 response regulator transcription factor [Bacillus sp. Xin]NSW39520.1 response regulator transcription factor [Bacillus sp. Xin1]